MFGRKKRITKTGTTGEDIAAKYLETHGYRILDRNFTTDVGEVDIFATDEKTLIVVEVKSRLSLKYGTPAEAVGHEKMRKYRQPYRKRIRELSESLAQFSENRHRPNIENS